MVRKQQQVVPGKKFFSLRTRLAAAGLVAIAPAWVLMYFIQFSWLAVLAGILGVAGAWLAAERLVLRKVRVLSNTVAQFAAGELGARTGLANASDELGELARIFDSMADSLQAKATAQAKVEKALMTRAFQQTVVSALGQFALMNSDFSALLHQAVILVAQTLEVKYCEIFELLPDKQELVLRAGVGWEDGLINQTREPAGPESQAAVTFSAGEPVVFEELAAEHRFKPSQVLLQKGVVSGMRVVIAGQGRPFGILGAHTMERRKFTDDEGHFIFAVATVVAMAAARKRAAGELEKLAAFAELNPNAAMEVTAAGEITYCNEAARNLARSVGQNDPKKILPSSISEIVSHCLNTSRSIQNFETHVERRTWSWSFHPVSTSRVVHAYVADITENLNLEAQLRHSQKLESVGQLAAGVAHDFNNMLTIIQGHAGLLLTKTGFPPQFRDSAQAISFAAERAAALTRQLLLFSRRSIIQPKPMDLREVVSTLSKMLQRLIGETVLLQFEPPQELPMVQGDAGMIEQVIMNLAVNGRDAMPKGGILTIRTSQVTIDEHYAPGHPEARPGDFVCLEVADTGCGMDAITLARIFEPFFTTKEVGKGTGLGLATVYGIVKQHEGWVQVESEVGKGTTFSVFLPVLPAAEATKVQSPVVTAPQGGKETVLVVEDEKVLRELARLILEDSGYRVIEASSGVEAEKIWEQHRETIDLVLTDMIMPGGLSGIELAQKLLASKPELKVIVVSGYCVEDFASQFSRKGHAVFLQKPYTHLSLTRTVRECLDGE